MAGSHLPPLFSERVNVVIFYDFEVFKEDWLAVFIDVTKKKEYVIINNPDELKALYEANSKDIWVGYNNRHYDQYIFKGILLGMNPKRINDWIIVEKREGWQFSSAFNKVPMINYDVMPNPPVGLKTLEGFLGSNIKETDVDFRINRKLTKEEIEMTVFYCRHDVEERLNDLANSEAFQTFIQGAIEAMATLANILLNIFELVGTVGGFIADNWSVISPIIYGVIAALAVYAAYLGIVKGIEIASAAATAIHSVAMSAKIGVMAALTGQTMAATAAQMGYNGALYACPVVWIIVLIIALIAVIMAVCSAIAKMTGIANSGFGVITGGVNVVIQFFKNLGLTVANIALGIGNAIAALASNMMTAFHNAICSVQSWFYNLLSTALSVIEGICSALNKLPFVEFDYSGISSAADDYAAKASEAAGNKEDYQSISDAFNEGFTTFDAFQDGWASDAFNAGAAWGDGIADKVSNFSLSDVFGQTDIPNVGDYTSGFNDAIANSGVGDSIGNIDDNTGKIKDSLDVTEEDLKYLRDIAEQEAINRFTTAEINVDMSGMQNTVNSGDDIDGFMTKLTDSVNEAVDNMTEGVHE